MSEPIVPPGYKLAEPGDIVINGQPCDVVALWNERNTLRAKLDEAQARVLELEARKDATTWEADHQGAILKRWGLYDEFVAGCDSIDGVCEAMVASRGTTRHLREVVNELKQEVIAANDEAATNKHRVQRLLEAVELAFKAGYCRDRNVLDRAKMNKAWLAYKAGLKGEG